MTCTKCKKKAQSDLCAKCRYKQGWKSPFKEAGLNMKREMNKGRTV